MKFPKALPNLPFLKSLAESQCLLWMEDDIPCGTVRLPQTWEGYLALLKPRFRTKVRSVLRDLKARPEVQFGMCESVDEIRRMLPILFDLHTRRWAEDGKPGVFGWEQKRNFYHDLSKRLLERGWLRFSWLEWKGRTLACQYGFVYEGAYSQLQEGYEPASEHWNVGIGLRAWTIHEFMEGRSSGNTISWVEKYCATRSDWGAEVKNSKHVLQLAQIDCTRTACSAVVPSGRSGRANR